MNIIALALLLCAKASNPVACEKRFKACVERNTTTYSMTEQDARELCLVVFVQTCQ